MAAALTCPGCQRPLRLPETMLGRTVRCPLCWEDFLADQEQARVVEDVPPQRPGPAEHPEDDPATPVVPAGESFDVELVLPVLPLADGGGPIVPPGPRRAKPLRFPAFLSKDPDRLLKGLWEGELTDDGLRLTRARNPEVWVSVGRGAARYLGGNRLTVRVRGRDVTVTIISNGIDQVRLARDVAAFLNNERDALDPGAYRVRRLLYVASLAPLGAPALALALHVHTRTGLGVAGWVGLGVAAALVALVLLRRGAWSVRRRLIASAFPALLAFAAVGIAYAAGGAAPPPVEPGQWRTATVSFEDGTPPFTVRMPGTPQPAVEFYGWWGDLSVVRLPRQRTDFAAGALALSPADRDRDENAIYNDKRNLFLRSMPGATALPASDRAVTSLMNYRGREMAFRIEGPRFNGVLVVRLYLVSRTRLYFLAVAGTHLEPRGPDAVTFLESMQPSQSAPPPQNAPLPDGRSAAPPELRGLVRHWSFDDGHPANGAYRGCQAEGAGVRGKALHVFGIANSYFEPDREAKLDFGRGEPFTFVGWLRTSRTEATVLSLRQSDDADPRIDLTVSVGRPRLYVHDDDGGPGQVVLRAEKRIDDNQWHHFAFTRARDGTVRLSIDGQAEAWDAGVNTGGAITTDRKTLGRLAHAHDGENVAAPSATFDGWLDDVALYDRVLSDDEVRRLARLP